MSKACFWVRAWKYIEDIAQNHGMNGHLHIYSGLGNPSKQVKIGMHINNHTLKEGFHLSRKHCKCKCDSSSSMWGYDSHMFRPGIQDDPPPRFRGGFRDGFQRDFRTFGSPGFREFRQSPFFFREFPFSFRESPFFGRRFF